jgi:signal transduction histidine kinase
MSPLPPKPDPALRPLRLLFFGTLLLIILVLATNAALILQLRRSELRAQTRELETLSLTLSEQADRAFQSLDLVLASVATYVTDYGVADRPAFERDMASHEIERLLQEKITGIPQIDAVTLINADGDLVNFSRYWPIPKVNVADRDYFKAMKADPKLKTFISAPVRNRGTGTWTIYLARRLVGRDGQFLGLVLGAMRLRYFEDFYRAVSPGSESSIDLVRGDGMLLARYPATEAVGIKLDVAGILKGGVAGTVRGVSPVDGMMRIIAAHALANYPLFILVTKTEDAALANWRHITRMMALAALLCAASIAAAGLVLGRHWRQQTALAKAQAEIADAERARLVTDAELRRSRDVTAAFDAMRLAKEEAEAANRAKSDFLAKMSQELQRPLSAIMGLSEEVIAGAMGSLGGRGAAQDIQASGKHLLDVVNDILDLSKATAGKLELTERWIDAQAELLSVCRLIRPRLNDAGLSLATALGPEEIRIHADERMLQRMLLNLLWNACRFTPEGGRVEARVAVERSGVAFVVRDTGIGIPADQLERVVQPFVQLDAGDGKRDGTGLGLALVKAMAERHGGSLRLESTLGAGTTATIMLPLTRLARATNELQPRPQSAAANG